MILLTAALLQATAAPETRFAPPIGRDLIYETVEMRTIDGRPARFAFRNRVRFSRIGKGYRLDVVQADPSADAPEPARSIFLAGMMPFDGITISLFLTAAGEPGAVIDIDRLWTAILKSHDMTLDEIERRRRLPPKVMQVLRDQFARFAAIPRERHDAIVGAWPRGLIARPKPPSVAPHGSGPTPRETRETSYSPDTGLLARETVKLMPAGGGAPLSERTTTLLNR